MEARTVYDWQQENLTLEKQRDILEKRREYLLQLMPDDVDVAKDKGTKDSGLVTEWTALQQHRDKILHALIDKENKKSLDSCYLNLLHLLTTIGTFDHSSTSQPLKVALYTLYWELKKYFGDDVDIANTSLLIDRSLSLGATTSHSPQKRKNKKPKVKLSRPDLIPSVHRNVDSVTIEDEVQSPKRSRYKSNSAASPSVVAVSSDQIPLLSASQQAQSGSEWESTDESFCSIEITDLNTSVCSSNATDSTLTPVRTPSNNNNDTKEAVSEVTPTGTPKLDDVPRIPLSNTPLNVSFTDGRGEELVTPKSADRAPDFGKTPVSTRTPLIRGITPPVSKSTKRSTPYKRTPYRVVKSASPYKRRSPRKTSPRRTISAQFRRTPSLGTPRQSGTESPAASETASTEPSETSRSRTTSDDLIMEIDKAKEQNDGDTCTERSVQGEDEEEEVLSRDDDDDDDVGDGGDDEFNVEMEEKENIATVESKSSTDEEMSVGLVPLAHAVDPQDRAVALAVQRTFQNYRRGGVYTSPGKGERTDDKEESFNISID